MAKHSVRCESAKHDKCNCSCKGSLHRTRKKIKGQWQLVPLQFELDFAHPNEQTKRFIKKAQDYEPSLDLWTGKAIVTFEGLVPIDESTSNN